MVLNTNVRQALSEGHLAHLVTLNPDGSPQLTVIWIGLDGDEIVSGHMNRYKKIKNISQDSRVTLSLVTGGKTNNLDNYLIISGHAHVTEGGAPKLLNQLAKTYQSDIKFDEHGSGGYIIHITVDQVSGIGPWQA